MEDSNELSRIQELHYATVRQLTNDNKKDNQTWQRHIPWKEWNHKLHGNDAAASIQESAKESIYFEFQPLLNQ
jgi:hypothetical protein